MVGFVVGFVFIVLDLLPLIFISRKLLDFAAHKKKNDGKENNRSFSLLRWLLGTGYLIKLVLIIMALYFVLDFYQISILGFSVGIVSGLFVFCVGVIFLLKGKSVSGGRGLP